MDFPLLNTKFHFPVDRHEIVSRPRLVQRLEQGLSGPLTLISGSAGSGKTTLLKDWDATTNLNYPIAWLSLDEGDNDPTTFLLYLVASLNEIQAGILDSIAPSIQASASPQIESILIALLNRLGETAVDFVLVLDDYHLITHSDVHRAISFLIQHLPYQMHMVILSRMDPPIALARIRSSGKLVEIRDQDLRFSLDESTEFLNKVMRLQLQEKSIQALEDRTEGWIAGLQMAALSLRACDDPTVFIEAFTGSHRFIMDYLTEEILKDLSENVRDFLFKTAVLTRFNAALCQSITGYADSQSIIEHLDAANLFIISLDNDRNWYRYHHLFADLLKNKVNLMYPEMVGDQKMKAAIWCQENGLIAESIDYAISAKNYTFVADQVENLVRLMKNFDNRNSFKRWVDRLPREIVARRAWLCAADALALTSYGQLNKARDALALAEKNLLENGQDTSDPDLLEGLIAGIYAWIYEKENDLENMLTNIQKSQGKLPEEHPISLFIGILASDVHFLNGELELSAIARKKVMEVAEKIGNVTYQVLMAMGLGHIKQWRGELNSAVEYYQKAAKLAESQHLPRYYLGIPHTSIAYIHLKRNELEAAQILIEKSLQIFKSTAEDENISKYAYIIAAYIHMAYGDLQKAAELIALVEKHFMKSIPYPDIQADWDLCRVRFWLAQGKLDQAMQWKSDHSQTNTTCSGYCSEQYALAFSRIHLANGRNGSQEDFRQAEELLSSQISLAKQHARNGRLIELLALKAQALSGNGQKEQAREVLAQALCLAYPENYLRPFLDDVSYIKEFLPTLKDRNQEKNAFIDQILSKKTISSPLKLSPVNLIEPLTEREQGVLRLMAAGMSNPEIAQELYLSLNTIKTHLKSIFGKLEVKNRTQASNRAKELDLL